jgi:hypothetical protein
MQSVLLDARQVALTMLFIYRRQRIRLLTIYHLKVIGARAIRLPLAATKLIGEPVFAHILMGTIIVTET